MLPTMLVVSGAFIDQNTDQISSVSVAGGEVKV